MDTQTTTPEPVAVQPEKAPIDWTGIALFIVLTFGISWVIWLGLAALGVSFTIRVAIGMFGPAIAATIVRLICRDGFADAGLRLAARGRKGVIRIYIAAYIIPPILIAAGIGLALLTGVQHWAFSENLHAMANIISLQLQSVGQVTSFWFLSIPIGFNLSYLSNDTCIYVRDPYQYDLYFRRRIRLARILAATSFSAWGCAGSDHYRHCLGIVACTYYCP